MGKRTITRPAFTFVVAMRYIGQTIAAKTRKTIPEQQHPSVALECSPNTCSRTHVREILCCSLSCAYAIRPEKIFEEQYGRGEWKCAWEWT